MLHAMAYMYAVPSQHTRATRERMLMFCVVVVVVDVAAYAGLRLLHALATAAVSPRLQHCPLHIGNWFWWTRAALDRHRLRLQRAVKVG